jgi:hypothetical protein
VQTLNAALKKMDDLGKDAAKKAISVLQTQLDADPRYGSLGVRVTNAALEQAKPYNQYRGNITVSIFNVAEKLEVSVIAEGGDVQCDISPESLALLDKVKAWADSIVAKGNAAYFGTWRGQSIETYGYPHTYVDTISAGEYRFRATWSYDNSTEIWVMNQPQWRLVNDNTSKTDYNQFGYELSGSWESVQRQEGWYRTYIPKIYLHKTDPAKLLIEGDEYRKQ